MTDDSREIDLGSLFGPLASVHAALDAAGHGRPCAVVAHFPGHDVAALEGAVGRARAWFPILGRRLEWHGGRPMLVPAALDGHAASMQTPRQILAFSAAAAEGQLWRYSLHLGDGGVWLFAGWTHAVADGLSMLYFLRAVAAALAGRDAPVLPRSPRPNDRRMPYFAWLSGFLLSQFRRHRRFGSTGTPGGTWLILPPALRDRLLREAAEAGVGFAAWFAAAAALAACLPARRQVCSVNLNVPIARNGVGSPDAFGFGVGSLLVSARIRDADNVASVAPRIQRRLQRAVERGWDLNLNRFLGDNAARHQRLARLQTTRFSRSISISWKGVVDHLGGADGVRDIACFGATPTLHFSGHADANGLSLSLTSAQDPLARAEMLLDVAELLGTGRRHRLFDLDEIAELSRRADNPPRPATADSGAAE